MLKMDLPLYKLVWHQMICLSLVLQGTCTNSVERSEQSEAEGRYSTRQNRWLIYLQKFYISNVGIALNMSNQTNGYLKV